MNSVAKIIATNLMVLISLILFLDFVSLIILEGNYLVKESSKGDEYSEESVKKYMKNFPVYEGVDWAEKYHREKGKTKTKYYSYYGWRCSPFKGEMINIDSQGVRLTVNSTAPQSDTSIPTTVFLGGSTIWGIGVQDKYTIPSFFAKKNKEPNHVINFGEGGYSAYQSLQFLQIKIIEGLRPGLIVTYDGVNNTPVRIKRFFAHSREQQIAVRLDGIDN
ncbi:MAG: hypothetical protein AB8G22_28310, partial [Saprospiraceae bacterium]